MQHPFRDSVRRLTPLVNPVPTTACVVAKAREDHFGRDQSPGFRIGHCERQRIPQ